MKVLDTSFLIDYLRGIETAEDYYSNHKHEPLMASTVSGFELAFGLGTEDDTSVELLRESISWVEFVDLTLADGIEGARINAEQQASGDLLPISDMLIAGVARNRGATVVTSDAHFDSISGLEVDFHR